MDNYDSRIQQISERALTAKTTLWTAILTAHTVLLSVAVAILVTVKPSEAWPFKLSGFIAVVCMLAILLNLALTKSQYEVIGQRLKDPDAELSDQERNQDLRNAIYRRQIYGVAEIGAMLGLALQVMLLAWVLAAS